MHSSAQHESSGRNARSLPTRSLAFHSIARTIVARLLDLEPERIGVSARGFAVHDTRKRQRLERITSTVVYGYRAALRTRDPLELAHELTAGTERELCGFAFEGAGLALQVLDALLPRWKGSRWGAFASNAAQSHVYMVHVGAGLGLGRLRRRLKLPRTPFDPLLAVLVADGYGFHDGYFGDVRRALARGAPARVAPAQHAAYDQGLGRSLWFVAGADARGVAERIQRAAPARHTDLWSGIGLAAAYAGAATDSELAELRVLAGEHQPSLAQGAAFAAEARARAGNPAEHTERACTTFASCSAAAAARSVRDVRAALGSEHDVKAYARWQSLVREHFDQVSR